MNSALRKKSHLFKILHYSLPDFLIMYYLTKQTLYQSNNKLSHLCKGISGSKQYLTGEIY